MKISGTVIAVALYLFAAWRASGWKGLAASAAIVAVVAVSRVAEKGVSRNVAFWLDLVYWSLLLAPFLLKQ